MFSCKDKFDSYTEERDSCIEEMAIMVMISVIYVPFGCTTISLTLPEIFKLKELEKSIKEME